MPNKPVLFFILLAFLFQTRCVSRKSKSVVAKKQDKESLLTLPELIPYRDGELWGFADSTGKIIVQPKYNYVEGFKNGFAIVYKDRQGNIIDKNGHELLPRSFSQISVYQDYVKVGTEAKLFGLYTKTGKEIFAPEYTLLHPIVYSKDENPAIFQFKKKAEPENEKSPYRTGIINLKGREILSQEGNYFSYKFAGVIETKTEEQLQYFNLKGKPINSLTGYQVSNFRHGLAVISQNKRSGFTDSTGTIKIPLIYEEAKSFTKDGLAGVKQNGKWGFIDRSGKMVIEPRYDNVRDFAFGISIVTKNEKQGIINTAGEELTEIKYDQIYANQAGKVYHLNEGRYTTWTGLLSSKAGRPTFTIIENKRIRISSTGENTALAFTYINSDHRGGLMDYDGNMVIPFEYNDIMSEKYGMSAVRKGDFWGVVNLQNEVVIPIVHALADVAGPDLFIVTQEIDSTTFLSGLINRKGEAITPKEYSRIYQLNENLFSVYKGEQMGIIDAKGNIIVPLIQLPESYRLYQGWQQGLIEVSSTRGWPYSFINPEGKLIESTYKPMGFIDRYGRVYFKDKPFEKR